MVCCELSESAMMLAKRGAEGIYADASRCRPKAVGRSRRGVLSNLAKPLFPKPPHHLNPLVSLKHPADPTVQREHSRIPAPSHPEPETRLGGPQVRRKA